MSDQETRAAVRARYAEAAQSAGSSCGCACGSAPSASTSLGYDMSELATIPQGADLALGCGNPTALAGIVPGETVLDLGSGAGIDCFLAAKRVGPNGRVIGVDMTTEMVERARRNASEGGFSNVEFRLGEIEHLPLGDAEVDLIISNCVINLTVNKAQVLREALRVLRPGGRLLVSDLVLGTSLPPHLAHNMKLLTGCIAGAMLRQDFLDLMREQGFADVRVERESPYLKLEHLAALGREAGIRKEDTEIIASVVQSVSVAARKPKVGSLAL